MSAEQPTDSNEPVVRSNGSDDQPPGIRQARKTLILYVIISSFWTLHTLLISDAGYRWGGVAFFWAITVAQFGWIRRCHLTGRDPADNRYDRYFRDHRVTVFVVTVLIVGAIVVLNLSSD